MLKRSICWASALLAGISNACVQVTLKSVVNNGYITDTMTPQDEIYTWFGVDDYFLFTYKNTFKRNQGRLVDPGLISMPCFHESVFYIDMTEKDDITDEKSQIVMACKNFQLGENKIVMSIKENQAMIASKGKVTGKPGGITEFDFGGSTQVAGTAQYIYTFDVVQECKLREDYKAYLIDKKNYDSGQIHFYSMSMPDVVLPKVEQENANIKSQTDVGTGGDNNGGGSQGDSSQSGGSDANSGGSSTSGGGSSSNSGGSSTSGDTNGGSSDGSSGGSSNGGGSANGGSSTDTDGGTNSGGTSGGSSGSGSGTDGGSASGGSSSGESGSGDINDININNFKGGGGGAGGNGGGNSDGSNGGSSSGDGDTDQSVKEEDLEDGGSNPTSWTIDGFQVDTDGKDDTDKNDGSSTADDSSSSTTDGTSGGSSSDSSDGSSNDSSSGGPSRNDADGSNNNSSGKPEQVDLETGDTVSLETDVGSDVFANFASFKSTQFFVENFEDADDLMTGLTKEEEEQSWMMRDSSIGMPNWTLILLVVLLILFIALGFYISRTMKKNKDHRDAQELAIIQELQLAKSEGLDIPADLEARLARFQEEEWKDDGKKSGKVHPSNLGESDMEKKGGRGQLTRYANQANQNSSIKPFNKSDMQAVAAAGMNSMIEETMATPGATKGGKLTRFQQSSKDKEGFNETVGTSIIHQNIEDSSFGTTRKSNVGQKVNKPMLGDCHMESLDMDPYYANAEEDKNVLK